MRVQANDSVLVTANTQRVAAERGVQQVFTDILSSVGRSGFASAEASDGSAVTADEITDSWHEWLNVSGHTRYTTLDAAESTLEDFSELMVQAHDAGAYAAPQAFLSGLSDDQLQTIQHVHHLAQPINVGALSDEGALNLLLPPPAQVDLNHDGLTQSGIGYSLRFPDSHTPRAVADAWEEATAGLSFSERMTRELQMTSEILLANIQVDDQGRFLSRSEPGDADFVNPMASSDYSYLNKARKAIESLESFKNQTPPDQYARDHSFWTAFESALQDNDAV
ncbi:hypothetical protein [Symmachiella macrocystis]|nr:hypothetical protein [Symmachiella macrocystis]